MPPVFATPVVEFYFDVVCPYAYIASQRIPDVATATNATCIWTPVLLGGLYDLTNAEQGKAGSASDVMPPSKKKMVSADFNREVARYQIALVFHPKHPVKSLDAGRLLCAFPDKYRPLLAHALFKSYWVDNDDISSRATLLRIARNLRLTSVGASTHSGPFSLSPDLPFALDETVFLEAEHAEKLRANTMLAFQRGVFGVPSFWIEERQKLFWGQDRLPLVEAELISIKVGKPISQIRQLERLLPRCLRTPPEERRRRMTFWFDFSSPYAYLGYCALERIQRDAGSSLQIVLRPFLLGALFKEIGTPMLPGQAQNKSKVAYGRQDLMQWSAYTSAVNSQEYPKIPEVNLRWPEQFPIRSVTALRVAILEPKVVDVIFRAAWRDDKNISLDSVLISVLNAVGFEGDKLVEAVTIGPRAEEIKATLRKSNADAIALGICGAPTFQVGKHLVWGQDRVHVVEDLVAGWNPTTSNLKASVASFPHFDYRI